MGDVNFDEYLESLFLTYREEYLSKEIYCMCVCVCVYVCVHVKEEEESYMYICERGRRRAICTYVYVALSYI